LNDHSARHCRDIVDKAYDMRRATPHAGWINQVMSNHEYDVVIAGGGIAGLTAALVSAREGRKTRVLTGPALGGHLLSIERVDGYPGFPDGVPGYELCPIVQEQAAAVGAEFGAAQATRLDQAEGRWRVTTREGDVWARAVVIATGTTSKTLGIPGEARLRGKGVSHCASCDGPLLRARIVGVVGGGDSALQEALTLAQHATRVIVLHRGTAFSAQAAYCHRVHQDPKIDVRFETIVEEVFGDGGLTGVRTRTVSDGRLADLELAGLFVYVGLAPTTAWLDGLLELDRTGGIPTDDAMRCRQPGLFAAGTVRAGSAGRAAAAAGDGATAAIAAHRYLKDGVWPA
jgi:thioredoxin reductase (NADPH)